MMEQKTITIRPFADTGSRYTMVDNYLFDNIMPSIKPNSWKVLSLILRKTTGWHKNEDQLSYSQIREGTGISSQSTVQAALKELVDRTLIIQRTSETKWEAFSYSLNRSFTATISVLDENEPSTVSVTEPSTEIVTEPSTVSVNTKESSKDSLKIKDSSAIADFSRPISLLSEKEVKALKLPLASWQQHLVDEQAERNRAGVISFLEKKIAKGRLLPDTPASQLLFKKITIEYDARGQRPPDAFPTLAIKQKFDKAAGRLNGMLEQAIQTGIENIGIAIPKLVNYISSPKWQEGQTNEQRPTRGSQQRITSQTPETTSGSIPIGSGQTPEMRSRLEAHFGRG